jgi:hypothetical protein
LPEEKDGGSRQNAGPEDWFGAGGLPLLLEQRWKISSPQTVQLFILKIH